MRWHAPLPVAAGGGDSDGMTAPAALDALPSTVRTPLSPRRARVALVERGMTRPATPRVIHRPRLTRPLTETAGQRLVTLVAPAGYGKTTLLRDWADRDERPFAWVTLDGEDNDPACLRASVALAAGRVEPQRGTGRFVLVLDDAQALHAPAAHAALAVLLAGLPPEVTLALASRTPPPLPVARMRAQGGLVELGAHELAMDPGEAAAMLAHAGLALGDVDVGRLRHCTEGWPAALALAALGNPEGFGGTDRLVADYVRDELLGGLSPEHRRLVRETSVLETLTGSLCDWVLQRDGSAAALVAPCRQDGLLIPLDRSDERFRHHRLVAEMLRAELRRLDPDRAAALHRRASDWYRAAGDDDRAVRHAVGGGDVEAAGELVWHSTWPAVSRGDKQGAEAWQSLFTDAERAATPSLALAAASTQLVSGQGHLVEHWLHVAAAVRAPSPAVAAGVGMMRAALARDGLARMRADAARARDLAPEGSPGRAMCCLLAGTAAQLVGDEGDAVTQLEEGAYRAAVSAPDVHALCLTQLALPALAREDWEEAGALVTRARAQVERHGLGGYPSSALVLAASALVRAHRGRVEGAQRDLGTARDLRAQLTDFAAWYEVELSVVLARVAVRLGDSGGARDLLADASRAVRRLGGAAMLEAWLEDSWARRDSAVGPATVTPSSLTTAELRTLHFLPTHLSFREIGERVYVSANTVKTQANAVYRKLDVSCRSEAVSRARQLGLLDA
jgi:LuxR family transcriptional regulator, maltose regulon positive regulatory protein